MRPAVLLVFSVLGCVIPVTVGSVAPIPAPTAQGAAVKIGKSDPPAELEDIGPITVAHGDGCGSSGHAGSYEGAYALMRNEAGARGAEYVRLDVAIPPHREGTCAMNAYTLQGVAFRRK